MSTDPPLPDPPSRDLKRLDRQFDQFQKLVPFMRGPLGLIRARGWWIIRLPFAILFILGGLASILPFLGLWMLPVGLLLLAIDLPLLRGPVSASLIRGRRRYNLWQRRRLKKRNKNNTKQR